jgi:DNA-directed RNA polymerase subunit alpha
MDAETATDSYGRFSVEPFERGCGTTIGNGLRRVLLSSIEGTAVTSVKVEGVVHEYSTIPGVYEDVTNIILAIKKLRVRMHTDAPTMLRLEATRKGEVTAGMIEVDHNVEVVNPNLRICTLTDDVHFQAEIQVKKGRGYVTAEDSVTDEMEVGTIPVDAIFSPVYRVKYGIENTRVGKFTNYDRLVVEIWTDGTVGPEMALVEASKIYRKHLNPFVQYGFAGPEMPTEERVEAPAPTLPEPERNSEHLALRERLALPISDLDLSVRASNCLESENVRTIGDLVRLNENELLSLKNFGKTSLREVKQKLLNTGLDFVMDVEALVG